MTLDADEQIVKRKLPLQRSLQHRNPNLATQWHHTKNGSLTPAMIAPGSGRIVWWICDKDKSHEWPAQINSRNRGGGCPHCYGRFKESLAEMYPGLANEWSNKNQKAPTEYTPGSSAKVIWKCSVCLHDWPSTIVNRVNGNGCPMCAGKIPTCENSLEALYPEVAKRWHPTKNGKTLPSDVLPFSDKRYWWLCPTCDNAWRASPHNRVQARGASCKKCMEATQTSYPQLAIAHYLQRLFFGVRINYGLPDTKNRTVDIFIPELNLAIEYDGRYYHRDRLHQDQEKSKLVLNNSIDLIRLRADGLPDLALPDITIIKHLDQNEFTLTQCILDLLSHLQRKTSNRFDFEKVLKDVDLNRDGVRIRGLLAPVIKKRNARDASYDFLDEWHEEMNDPIRPEHVAAKSNADYWWRCRNNDKHVWPASFGTRSKGHGCPYCAGIKPDSTNSLGELYPALAAEWCQRLNGETTPDMILPNSNKEFWWTCPDCRSEYDTKPSYRMQGEACPYCAGKRVNHTNSLAVKYPAIAAQWHPEKNGELTPHNVSSGSKKRVWWLCSKGHGWPAVIYSRKTRGCPHCYKAARQQGKRRTKD